MLCRICQQELTLQPGQQSWKSHFKNVHPEYVEWRARWTRNFLIFGTVDVAILVAVFFLVFLYWALSPVLETTIAIIVVVLYSIPIGVMMMQYFRRVAYFTREWREQHPTP